MKIFKFKFTKLTYVMIFVGLAVAAAAFGVNTFFLISEGISSAADIVYPIIQYSVTYFVSALLFVILISLLVSSYYSIDGNTLKTSFGIIKSKYAIDTIETIVLDRETDKLSVNFSNNTFMVIVVKEEWYEDLIDALLEANPKIEYTIKSKENHEPDDNKKK